jgi:hypothetical protein
MFRRPVIGLTRRRKGVPPPGVLLARNRRVEKVSCQRFSLACQSRACRSSARRPKSNREKGFSESRRRRNAVRFFPSCSPTAPIIARTRGGSEAANLRRRSNRPISDKSIMVRLTVSSGESSLDLPARRRKSSNAASLSERPAHASGLRVWITVSLPTSFRGRLRALVETSFCLAVWVVNPRRLAAAMPEGKIVLCREASFWIAAGFGRLFPKAVLRVL